MICRPEGPIPSRIMLVGEAPGYEEEQKGLPFQGASGQELNRMLGEAGITRNECFITNVVRLRPPNNDLSHFIAKAKKDVTSQHIQLRGRSVLKPVYDGVELLRKEIAMVQPNIIVALGATPLWALTGVNGITKWRGSMLYSSDMGVPTKVIPTLHPAYILRDWSSRAVAINDLRRAAKFRSGADYPKPNWRFIIRPTFAKVTEVLNLILQLVSEAPLRLSFDLETRGGHIACAGLSWTLEDAICIPFIYSGFHEYWSAAQEAEIIYLLYKILTHTNAKVVGQNILYDSQYTYRHWCFVPRVVQDCMISQHSIFSDLPKSLAFQASMYTRYYKFWKDEGKNI